jgi:signal transduction histidine kinase
MNLLKKIILLCFVVNIFICQGQNSYYKDLGEDVYGKEQEGVPKILYDGFKTLNRIERLDIFKKAYDLSKKEQDSSYLPYIYFAYADTYYHLTDNQKALFYLKKIETLVNWKSHNFLLSRVYSYIAVTHQLNNNLDEAIKYHNIILKKSKFNYCINLANSNIMSIYIEEKKYDIARPYIDAIFKYYKNNTTEGLNHKLLAFQYLYESFYTDNVSEKIKYINKGIELTKERPVHNKVYAHIFRAKFYETQKKYNLAISDYKKSLQFLSDRRMKERIPYIYHSLSKIYLKHNNFKEALILLDSANNSIKHNQLELKKEHAKLRYKAYAITNNFEKAFFYAKEEIKYQDSIQKNKTDSLYAAYGIKYQTDKKIQENELLKKEGLIKDLEVKKQTTNRNYLIVFLLLGLITLGVTYNRFRLKRKTANALASQNAIIGNQKIELEKSNENKQKLFGIVAHDLVNPFNAILGYTKLLDDDYDSFNEEERKQFISIINTYATNNYKLTRTLLDWAKVQQDRLVVKKTKLNCKNIVQEAIQPYLVLADKKQIQINTYIPEHTFIEADKNMMQTVIGNLVVNAIKFTTEKGKINLHLYKNKDGTVNLEIKDNGIGMSQEQLNNLFDITKINTLNGTNNEKGNGLGLILCKELMELQQGSLQLFSKRNTGSRAIVTI